MTENRTDRPVEETPGALPGLPPGNLESLRRAVAYGKENDHHTLIVRLGVLEALLAAEAAAARLRKGLGGLLHLLPEDVFSLRDPRYEAWNNCVAFCRAALAGPKEEPPR